MLPFEAEGLVEATVGEPGEGSWFVARADDGALFEALVEELADRDLVDLVRQRLAMKDSAIEVDLDEL